MLGKDFSEVEYCRNLIKEQRKTSDLNHPHVPFLSQAQGLLCFRIYTVLKESRVGSSGSNPADPHFLAATPSNFFSEAQRRPSCTSGKEVVVAAVPLPG